VTLGKCSPDLGVCGRAASAGALTPEPPHATRSPPEFTELDLEFVFQHLGMFFSTFFDIRVRQNSTSGDGVKRSATESNGVKLS